MNNDKLMHTRYVCQWRSAITVAYFHRDTDSRWLPSLVLLAMLLFSLSAHAVHPPKVDQFWLLHDENSQETVNHSGWQEVLDSNLHISESGIALFDYANIDDASKRQLKSYLIYLQALDPRRYRRSEQLSYWINLYNALTVNLIISNYPTESIVDLGDKFFSFGPWDDPIASIQGRSVTLNDIEHRILRPIWKDNRIHYAVNCASMGCPNLSMKAYTAGNTQQQLESGAYDYVNHIRGVHMQGDDLIVSSIYHWYKIDFGDSDATLLEHFRQYASDELREQLQSFDGDIDHSYDWRLNQL